MPCYPNSSQRRGFTFPSADALLEHRRNLLLPLAAGDPQRPSQFVYRLEGPRTLIDHARLPEGAFKAYLCSMMATNPFQAFETAIATVLGEKQKPCETFGLDLDCSPAGMQPYPDLDTALVALQPLIRGSTLIVGSGAIRLEQPQDSPEDQRRANSCVSACVYDRWFALSAVPACPELSERRKRGRDLFRSIPASAGSFRNSFYHNAYVVAQYLCQRMCVAVSPQEYHPMGLVLLSLVVALKTVCCEPFNRSDMFTKYFPYLYGLQGSFLAFRAPTDGSGPEARRVQDPAAPGMSGLPGLPGVAQAGMQPFPGQAPGQAPSLRTRAFLETLHANLPTDELAILQRLNYSVYVVTPEEYLGPELVFRVLRAVLGNPEDYAFARAVAGLQQPPPDEKEMQGHQGMYSNLLKGALFTVEILRPTDALLLADPQLIAAFAVLEGLLLMSWCLYGESDSFVAASRAGLYRALAESMVDPDEAERLLLALHAGLFYFVSGTVPDVPEGIEESARAAMEECMPLGDLTTDVTAYEEFLRSLFDVKMDFAVVDDGGE